MRSPYTKDENDRSKPNTKSGHWEKCEENICGVQQGSILSSKQSFLKENYFAVLMILIYKEISVEAVLG